MDWVAAVGVGFSVIVVIELKKLLTVQKSFKA
jgi:hypothetical protein